MSVSSGSSNLAMVCNVTDLVNRADGSTFIITAEAPTPAPLMARSEIFGQTMADNRGGVRRSVLLDGPRLSRA
jgi:hypothetical protein